MAGVVTDAAPIDGDADAIDGVAVMTDLSNSTVTSLAGDTAREEACSEMLPALAIDRLDGAMLGSRTDGRLMLNALVIECLEARVCCMGTFGSEPADKADRLTRSAWSKGDVIDEAIDNEATFLAGDSSGVGGTGRLTVSCVRATARRRLRGVL